MRLLVVGIDLHELIRLKLISCLSSISSWSWSGLICMNWYDWNQSDSCAYESLHDCSRDWSAWIDTIETMATASINFFLLGSGLICMNWYDWNSVHYDTFASVFFYVGIDLHELIRLKHTPIKLNKKPLFIVGIDLHELIRLKRCSSKLNLLFCLHVGIDLHELIRLKLLTIS